MAGDKILVKGATNGTKQYQTVQVGGGGSANKVPALNGAGQFDPTMLPDSPVTTAVASGAISAGDLVNIFDSGAGVMKVRQADNTGAASSKKADGFAAAAIADTATGTISLDNQIVTGLSGLVGGAEYYLGTSGTLIDATTAAALSGGATIQSVGKALSATTLAFQAGTPLETV